MVFIPETVTMMTRKEAERVVEIMNEDCDEKDYFEVEDVPENKNGLVKIAVYIDGNFEGYI